MAYNSSYWPVVYKNLNKSWRQWGVIVRVLAKTGVTVRSRGMMYNGVSQSVLLYGSESWVVTGEMLKLLQGFHRWAARLITEMTTTRGTVNGWEYLPLILALESARLHPIWDYIRRCQANIAEKVSCRLFMNSASRRSTCRG